MSHRGSQRANTAPAYPLEFDEDAHEAFHRSNFLHRHVSKQQQRLPSSSLHSSANFDNTLPSVHEISSAHGPPDASDISPNSSQDAMSPQSRHSSSSMHTSSSSSSGIGGTRAPLDLSAEGDGPVPLSPEDFPLVSREPSRGPSKGSLRSVDPTNMHSPPKFYEQQRRKFQDVSPSGSVQRPLSRIAAERDERVLPFTTKQSHNKFDAIRAANGSHAVSRSVSCATTTALSATYSFINDAERRRHEAEEQKRKRLDAAQKKWEQHVANRREFNRPKVQQQNESAFQHRLFNLKVRELHQQEDMERTGVLPGAKRRGRSPHDAGDSSFLHQGLPYTEPPADGPRGPSFWDLQEILFYDFIHQIVPQQLNWIGKSGDRDRCAVPPMMTTAQAQREPIILSHQAEKGPHDGHQSVTQQHHQTASRTRQSGEAAYQALQEEKWFVAAQHRFHKIAQHE
jgi:hypothetical protein